MSNRTFCIAAALFGLLNTHAYGADAPKIYGALFAGIDAASTETTSTNVATGVATTITVPTLTHQGRALVLRATTHSMPTPP